MKSKLKISIIIILIIICALILLNGFRNYFIIKGIMSTNLEFEQNFSSISNFHYTHNSNSTTESNYMKTSAEIFYKDGILLEKTTITVDGKTTNQTGWYNFNTNEGIISTDNGIYEEYNGSYTDLDSICNTLLVYNENTSTNESLKNVLLNYLFRPILSENSCYIFNDNETKTYINKDSKLLTKIISEKNHTVTQTFEKNVVTDSDIAKPNM